MTIHWKMCLFRMRFVSLILLLTLSTCAFGLIKLPICQCECCPGEECLSELVVFSVDRCNKTSCSFEQCFQMYPKKCGLLPGLTRPFCDSTPRIATNSSTSSSAAAAAPPTSSSPRPRYAYVSNMASPTIQHSIISFVFISNVIVYMRFV